jgi:tripeptidyl-peptidase-1
MLKPGSKGVINATVPAGVGECDRYTTLDCLRALYGINYKGPRSPPNKNTDIFAVVEYTPGAYLPSDLDMFYTNYSSGLVGTRPKLVSIDGGTDQTTEQSSSNNAESDLDIQYAQGLIGQMNLTLYQVGDVVEGASFGNFLDGLDSRRALFRGHCLVTC